MKPIRRLKKWSRGMVTVLPKPVRHRLYRKTLRVPESIAEDLTFKVAETSEELHAAFRLLHDRYKEVHLMHQHPSGMRLTKYHLLPTTVVLIAKKGSEVIGTLSIIPDGLMGLPIDDASDISKYRQTGLRLAEISSLAVKPSAALAGAGVYLLLTKFMFEMCAEALGIDQIFVTCNKAHAEFYEGVLLFKRLKRSKNDYNFVEHESPDVLTLDLTKGPTTFRRVYGTLPKDRNLHEFYTSLKLPQIHLPQMPRGCTFCPSLSIHEIKDSVSESGALLSPLKKRDRLALTEIYGPLHRYEIGEVRKRLRRSEFRYPVRMPATVLGQKTFSLKLVDVSRRGFQVEVPKGMSLPDQILLQIETAPGKTLAVKGEVVWNKGDHFGVKIVDLPLDWLKYIKTLDHFLETKLDAA